MKKTLALVLALTMVSALCGMLFVSADDTNLLAGKSYTISEQFRMSNVTWGYDETFPVSYPDSGNELTDGYLPSDVEVDPYSADAWMAFNQQTPVQGERGYAYVQFDLGEATVLSSANVITLKDIPTGIQPAHTIQVWISDDGADYTLAGEYKPDSETHGALADLTVHTLEIELEGTARYVEFRFVSYGWNFLGELELYGSAATEETPSEPEAPESSDEPESSEPAEPEVETVEEVITIDGKLDDTGYTKATWFNKGVWQTVTEGAPILENIDIKYTTRSDAENIYLAVQVTDEVVFETALDPEYVNDPNKFSQAGATNYRLWFMGDGMTERTFFDLLWDGEKLVAFEKKAITDKIDFAFNTDDGVLTLELSIAKASLSITDSYKMMVTYSAPDFGEGETVGYNAYHMTEFVRGEDGALADKWSSTDVMYVAYNDADVVLGTYEVEVEKPETSEDTSSEESKPEESKPEESKPEESKPETSKPQTGDAGVLVFAVLGVVAIAGAAVVIKARG